MAVLVPDAPRYTPNMNTKVSFVPQRFIHFGLVMVRLNSFTEQEAARGLHPDGNCDQFDTPTE